MSTHTPGATATTEELPFGIVFDGRAYHYRTYRYERLQDAINYAELDRRRPGFVDPPVAPPQPQHWAAPTEEQRLQMKQARIVLVGTQFCYGPYRYDLLADALNYAKHVPGLAIT
jgi:hypothetical protein